MSIFNIKEAVVIRYSDLERVIQKEYNLEEYSIPCNEECGNNVALTFNVEDTILPEYEGIEVQENTSLYYVLNDLCYRNIINPGYYVVEVCW